MLEKTTANGQRRSPWDFMGRDGRRLVSVPVWGLLILAVIHGCGNGGHRGMEEKVLIRAGGSVVTVRAFHEAFESGIISPSQLFQNPDALRDEKYRVLNRLTEELLILERARELGLHVSDEETAQVVDDFKKDFPDDTFEKTLMENGVSFMVWKKALKRRLLMEKVIRKDLSEGAFRVPRAIDEDLGPDDEQHLLENEAAAGGTADENDLSEAPPRAMGAEAEYPDWINRLKQQYAIEIDWKLWEIIEQEAVDGV